MRYHNIHEGRFVRRLNRFIAEVEIEGHIEKVHVKNTGRCKELFVEGVTVYLEKSDNPNRKTKYSLVALYKGDLLINIDSQIPNYAVKEAFENNPHMNKVFGKVTVLKSEVTYGNSRFDLYYENKEKETKGFIEVKGVTLEMDGEVRFPDAPTTRGVKHLNELIKSVEEGYRSYAFFLVQMKGVSHFKPNRLTDPDFSDTLKKAQEKGVGILCFDSIITKYSIKVDEPVTIFI